MNTPFEITKEEVLQLAAQKLVDAYSGEPDLTEMAESLVRERVEQVVAKGLVQRVDDVLSKELDALLAKEIVPVDVWGEKAGAPTTIRAQLHQRAKEFWEVSVSEDGRSASWGGKPRHERLMEKIVKDEFAKAVKENIDVMLSGLKSALKEHGTKVVSDHIDSLVRIK